MGTAVSARCDDSCQSFNQNSMIAKRKALMEERKRNTMAMLNSPSLPDLNRVDEAGGFTLGKFKTTLLTEFFGARNNDAVGLPDDSSFDAFASRLKAPNSARSGEDELEHGAMRGDPKKVKRALDSGATIGFKNARGLTALMLASSSCGREALEVLKELLIRKADLEARDNNGWTCLHHACRNGKTEVARFLISNTADPSSITGDQKTVLMLATIEGKYELVKELTKISAVRKQVADKDALNITALHFAVKDGALEIAKLIVEFNGKVNAKDVDGKMPLTWACEHGKLDCAKFLAKKKAEIDAFDKNQRTPLLYCVINSYEHCALWLIKKTADPYRRDVQGESAMALADEMGLSEVRRAIKVNRMENQDDD